MKILSYINSTTLCWSLIHFQEVLSLPLEKSTCKNKSLSTAMMMTPAKNSASAAQIPQTERIQWIVRPTTMEDKDSIDQLLRTSYEHLLAKDYDSELLQIALPRLCSARPELLTSSTWYVAEHPQTGALVGCGGWTPQSPFRENIPHLRHFATHPEYTRQGIARALWDRTWHDWCEYYHATNTKKFKPQTINQNTDPRTSGHKEEEDKEVPTRRPDMEVFSTRTAESFYASLGFQKMKDIIIPISEDCAFPSILMRRPDTPTLSSSSSSSSSL